MAIEYKQASSESAGIVRNDRRNIIVGIVIMSYRSSFPM